MALWHGSAPDRELCDTQAERREIEQPPMNRNDQV
jgi:hypothetical protein